MAEATEVGRMEAELEEAERKAAERQAVLEKSMGDVVRQQLAVVEEGGRVFDGKMIPPRVVAAAEEIRLLRARLVEAAVKDRQAEEARLEKEEAQPKAPASPPEPPARVNYEPSVTGEEADKRRAEGAKRVAEAKAAAEAEDERQEAIGTEDEDPPAEDTHPRGAEEPKDEGGKKPGLVARGVAAVTGKRAKPKKGRKG